MKSIVTAIGIKARQLRDPDAKPTTLTDVQKQCEQVYRTYDFGCHNAAVAAIIGALTGHTPSKTGTAAYQLFDVVMQESGARCIILGVDAGRCFGISVDHDIEVGYYTLDATNSRKPSKAQFETIVSRFEKAFNDADLMLWMQTRLAGNYPINLLRALK